jgi:uncharacterized protein (TIGR02598 family)
MKKAKRLLSSNTAFSLVEVVLALGVTSFALLSMVALIPLGLSESREATDSTTESQIVQYARNEIEMTPFTNLSVWAGTSSYYDNQGLPTTKGSPMQIYTVSYAVTNVAMSTGGNAASAMYLNTGPNSTSTNAMVVQVNIVNRTAPGTSATNIFPIVVPNAGF